MTCAVVAPVPAAAAYPAGPAFCCPPRSLTPCADRPCVGRLTPTPDFVAWRCRTASGRCDAGASTRGKTASADLDAAACARASQTRRHLKPAGISRMVICTHDSSPSIHAMQQVCSTSVRASSLSAWSSFGASHSSHATEAAPCSPPARASAVLICWRPAGCAGLTRPVLGSGDGSPPALHQLTIGMRRSRQRNKLSRGRTMASLLQARIHVKPRVGKQINHGFRRPLEQRQLEMCGGPLPSINAHLAALHGAQRLDTRRLLAGRLPRSRAPRPPAPACPRRRHYLA